MSVSHSSVRLTVAVLVNDAAEGLRETLSSVQHVADELLVVNCTATDDAVAVARDLGARVLTHAWSDDFSAARNQCLEQVTGNWILWLEAGEQLSVEDGQRLRQQLGSHPDARQAYLTLVQMPADGSQNGAEQLAQIRIQPRHPAVRFVGRVRESLEASLQQHRLGIEPLPICITRHACEHEMPLKTEKARRNIRLAEAEIREQGLSARLLNCLGDACQTLRDNDRAAEYYRQAVGLSECGSADQLEAYYGLVTSLDSRRQPDEQLRTCLQALEVFPLDAQLLCAMGGYLQARGHFELALKSYQLAWQSGQVQLSVWHVIEVREIAAVCASTALQLLQRDAEALVWMTDAVAKASRSKRLRRHLIELHVKLGHRDEALEQVRQLPRDYPHREALRSVIRGACLASAGNWSVAKAYLKTGYVAGCREPLGLRWYATTLIALGDLQEAVPIVEEWLRAEPANIQARQYCEALRSSIDQSDDAGRIVRIDSANPLAAPPRHLGSPVQAPQWR